MRRRLALLIVLLLLAHDVAARCALKPEPHGLPLPGEYELVLATQNLWRFVDDHPDTSADQPVSTQLMQQRIEWIARYIGDDLRWPALLALQEVEKDALLNQLADRIVSLGGPRYHVVMREGLDPSGIDVALLYRDPVRIGEVSSPFHDLRYNHRYPLYSRPPLVITLEAPVKATLVVVHLRSGYDLEDARKGRNIPRKRREQAQTLRDWLQRQQAAGTPLIVAGDFNSSGPDALYRQPIDILAAPPFVSVWQHIPEAQRFSYIYQCRAQAIDNILVSPALRARIARVAVTRGNAGYQYLLYRKKPPHLVSDHDGLAVYLRIVDDGETQEGKD